MSRDTCQGTRGSGEPCRAWALPNSRFCLWHDPAQEGKRQEAREKGGRNKRTEARLTKLMPASLKPVLEKLMTGLDEVYDGTLEPRQASAMASLAGAIGRLYEVAEMEERLLRLEGQQNEQDAR